MGRCEADLARKSVKLRASLAGAAADGRPDQQQGAPAACRGAGL